MPWVAVAIAVAGAIAADQANKKDGGSKDSGLGGLQNDLAKATSPTLRQFDKLGGNATKLGFEDLISLLKQGGKIDPLQMNFQLADIGRRTTSAKDMQRDRFSRTGFGASGLNDAIMAAIGQGGDESAARLRADDAANSDARRRQNLQLLHDLVIGPATSLVGAGAGVNVANANLSNQQALQSQQGQSDFYSQLLSSGSTALSATGSK